MLPKIIIPIILLSLIFSCHSVKRIDKAQDTKPEKESRITSFTPDPYSSLVEMNTKYGTMKIELFFETSEHRTNFIKLAREGKYDSTIFHRVIKNFMAQGGDPTTKNARPNQKVGANGPGYELENEINSRYYHIKGALAAARQSDEVNPTKKSSGSQFYIVQGSPVSQEQLDKNERELGIVYGPEQRKLYQALGGSPQLDMNYTVFGRVYERLDIIDSIAMNPTDGNDRPEKDIKISIRVIKE
jgi:cyclophilin family peptidyl-prolyl cis-trans isomerase